MAIAPSKLGHFIETRMSRDDEYIVRNLRSARLVRSDVADHDIAAAIKEARDEHAAMSEEERYFNSPEERARVFLEPYLSPKGEKWAVPLDSLELRWWKFWR